MREETWGGLLELERIAREDKRRQAEMQQRKLRTAKRRGSGTTWGYAVPTSKTSNKGKRR